VHHLAACGRPHHQAFGGELAEGHGHARAGQRQLAVEEWAAGDHFLGSWIAVGAVRRWAAFDHVGDVDVGSG
jgi:hypothetical protein